MSKTMEITSVDVTENGKKPYPKPDEPVRLFDMSELSKWSLYHEIIAEFIATLLFLYITIATVIGYKNQSQTEACTGVGYEGVAWAFGGSIFVLVYCIGGISEGHINPAITFGFLVGRKFTLVRAVLYIIAQCLGAICGAGIVKGIMKHPFNSLGGGANSVAHGYSRGAALGAEIVGTFVLVYTVFSASDPERKALESYVPVLKPLAIGFAVFVVHLATIPITGTGINPARSLGAALIYNNKKIWREHWISWVGPLVGALIAVLYHKFVLRRKLYVKALSSFRSTGAMHK